MATTVKPKTLSTEVSKGGQSVSFKEILNAFGQKIRITVKSDSYRSQCFARVHVFKDLEWNLLDYIPSANMATKDKLIYGQPFVGRSMKPDPKVHGSYFKADRDKLLKLAKDILS